VLDQMSPLRQIAAQGKEIQAADAWLFAPGTTWAIHQGGQNGTPLPHEEPQEKNPPAGVVAYYWLKSAPHSPVKLELVDAKGNVAACVASDTPVKPVDTEAINVQAYWVQASEPPSAGEGMHRVALNVAAARGFGFGGGAAAAPPVDACHAEGSKTPSPAARGTSPRRGAASLAPGQYTVRFSVDGNVLTRPVNILPDPRGLAGGAEASPEGDDDDE
jgi:hypothetical protein